MRIGIIDIGSNTIHVDVFACADNEDMRVVYSKGVVNRLGSYLTSSRTIPQKHCDEAVAIIDDLIACAHQARVTTVYVFGTSILRHARNAQTIVRLVKKRCGASVDIVSARREARYLSAVSRVCAPIPKGNTLFVDIGGGSTEYVLTAGTRVNGLWSYAYGLSKVAAQSPHALYSEAGVQWLTHFFSRKVALIKRQTARRAVARIVGTSSVIKVIVQLVYGSNATLEGKKITVRHLREIQQVILKKQSYPRLEAVRTDLVYVGTFYFEALLNAYKNTAVYAHPFSVREGYARYHLNGYETKETS